MYYYKKTYSGTKVVERLMKDHYKKVFGATTMVFDNQKVFVKDYYFNVWGNIFRDETITSVSERNLTYNQEHANIYTYRV